MSDVTNHHIGILICLTSLDDEIADQSALHVAKLFGSRCRALLIEDQIATERRGDLSADDRLIARRRRRLTILAQEMGLNVDFDVSDLSPGIQHLRTQPVKATTILMQPAHPLSRQTHTFRSVQDAAAAAAAATVYSPPIRTIGDGDILAITNTRQSASIPIAEEVAKRTGRAFEIFLVDKDAQLTVSSLVRDLAHPMSLDAPALIVMTQSELLTAPSDFSSLAARLEMPVLVVGDGSNRGPARGVG